MHPLFIGRVVDGQRRQPGEPVTILSPDGHRHRLLGITNGDIVRPGIGLLRNRDLSRAQDGDFVMVNVVDDGESVEPMNEVPS